jgi:hypothetical protein
VILLAEESLLSITRSRKNWSSLVIVRLYFLHKRLSRNVFPVVLLFFIVVCVLTITPFVSTSIQGGTKYSGEKVMRKDISRMFLFYLRRQWVPEIICFLFRLLLL